MGYESRSIGIRELELSIMEPVIIEALHAALTDLGDAAAALGEATNGAA